MSNEVWKDISDYEGLYMISDLGNVRNSHYKLLSIFQKFKVGRKSGYRWVELWRDGKFKRLRLHRLVAKTFLPNPLNKKEVNHKNGIKSDNRVENLEWTTQMENWLHQLKNNLFYRKYTTTPEQWLILNV